MFSQVITVINDQHSCPLGEDGHVLLGVKESRTGQRHVHLVVKESDAGHKTCTSGC